MNAPRRLNPLCDRIGHARVIAVIDDFYARLETDPVLAPYFAHITDGASHRATVVDYWWLAMGGRSENPRTVDMVGAHRDLGITETATVAWLARFREALDAHLDTAEADDWYRMAVAMADKLRGMGLIRPE